MFFAYAIKSEAYDFYYKGFCENLEKRLAQHNSGETASNRKYAPFTIVYFEQFELKEDAIKREKYFKTAAGRRYLKHKLVS